MVTRTADEGCENIAEAQQRKSSRSRRACEDAKKSSDEGLRASAGEASPPKASQNLFVTGNHRNPLFVRDELRYVRRAKSARILRKYAADQAKESGQGFVKPLGLAECGQPVGGPHGNVMFTKNGLEAVKTCKSVHACSCCAPKIRAAKSSVLAEILTEHQHQFPDATVLFATGTTRHNKTTTVKRGIDVNYDGFRSCIRGAPWARKARKFGIFGHFKTVEITFPGKDDGNGTGRVKDSGPHVHSHIVFLHDRKLTQQEVAEFTEWFSERWQENVARIGGEDMRPDAVHGFRVDVVTSKNYTKTVGSYLTKLQEGKSLSNEIARGDLKTSRTGSRRTPFELLDSDSPKDKQLWLSYVLASKGRRLLTFSKGLKETLGVEEPTDEEIMSQESEEADESSEKLDDRVYIVKAEDYLEVLTDNPALIALLILLARQRRWDELQQKIPGRFFEKIPIPDTAEEAQKSLLSLGTLNTV